MENNGYRLGVVSVSFRSASPKEILEAAASAGLSCIEWGSDVHAPCRDLERLKHIAALQQGYHIQCSSYGTYFRLGETPLEELHDYIAAAKLLGTRVLRIWCGTKCGADCTDAEREALLEAARLAEEMARNADAVLCMECHRGTFTERLSDALLLMEVTHSPHFQMYWQPFQWQTTQQNLAYARAICGDTVNLHVFHWLEEQRFPLIEARDAWRSYLECFSKPRTLLLEFMPDDRLETLKSEADALREIVEV